MKMKDIMDKKPDFETEKLRGWSVSKEDTKKYKKEWKEEENNIEISKGDMKLQLMRFTEVRQKKNDKLGFAYKFRHDKGLFLYHLPKDSGKKEQEAINFIKGVAEAGGYEVRSTDDFLQEAIDMAKHLSNKRKSKK